MIAPLLSVALFPLLTSFAVYYLVLFVVCFLVVSQGQDALYDEPTPNFEWKVALGAGILAAALTYTHSSFATMFTDDFGKTVIQGILWFGVFTLIYRFHPWHAAGIGLATMLIVTGLATMGVDSMLSPRPTNRFESKQVTTPLRRPTGAPAPKPAAGPAAK